MDWNSKPVSELLRAALREDHAGEDATSSALIPPGTHAQARLLCRQRCRLAGLGLIEPLLRELATLARATENEDWQARVVALYASDGDELNEGQLVAQLAGSARALLAAERTLLNFIQHLSGIATQTARFVAAVAGTGARILDTRKTTPGLRELEKYAVRIGGGVNHRPHLAGGVLIKNNHLALAGGVEQAFRAACRSYAPETIEIEVRTLDEVRAARAVGARWLLLDNMTPEEVRAAALAVGADMRLEVSGGVRLQNVRAYAEAGIAEISAGALTHSAPAADFSLRLGPGPAA